MPKKFIDGTFVIRAKLKGTQDFVYCAGVSSTNHVLWVPELDKAVKIRGVCKSDLDNYVSMIWRLNDHYNELNKDYAVAFNVINIDKAPCNYMAFFGRIDKKSEPIDIADTTQKVARSIANHAKANYPRSRYFLYKSKAKFPDKYCPFKYTLIDNTTGLHSKDYYFIMEVPK